MDTNRIIADIDTERVSVRADPDPAKHGPG
jgi:hypothetical protein